MLYPFVIAVPVVAYGNADRIVRHPDALLVIHVYVVDCIAVHGVISVEVGHDVRFGPVSVHIHLVDTCTVCRYQYVFSPKVQIRLMLTSIRPDLMWNAL